MKNVQHRKHHQEMITGAEEIDLKVGTMYGSLLFLQLTTVGISGIHQFIGVHFGHTQLCKTAVWGPQAIMFMNRDSAE